MKKILIIMIPILLILSISALAGLYNRNPVEKCLVRGCNVERYEDSPYCRHHKCGIFRCNSRRETYGVLCPFHREQKNQNLKEQNSRKSSSGNVTQSSGKSSATGSSSPGRRPLSRSYSSGKTSFDPDDHDIESYYDDYRDEYDDYDDAYDGFLDDEDAWDDY